MPIEVLMPALSPTMTEGNLAKWYKKEGDAVSAGDLLAEIETDKATIEVEAVDEGVLGRILVADGTEGVAVNTPIALLLAEGEDAADLDVTIPTAPAQSPLPAPAETPPSAPPPAGSTAGNDGGGGAASPLARRMAAQAGLDLAAIPGSGPHGRIVKRDVEAAASGAPSAAQKGDGRIFASPLARKMAAQAGLDLAALGGSGPGGRIVKADIDAALAGGAPPAPPAEMPAPAPAVEAPGMPAYSEAPHSTMRKVIARRLVESKREAPHFYLTIDCRLDELLKVRKQLNARSPEGEGAYKISINDFVIRAVALALMKVPAANASWTDTAIRRYHSADISVAVAVPDGLITPVVRGAEGKGLAAISNEMKDLAMRAREGKLMPEEYQGGSFSISNLGMFEVREFAAVINPPQGCILAVGVGEQRAVVSDGALAVATVMSCTLSIDHRVVDGAVGAEFLAAFKKLIEDPLSMLL
ncbi:MAG: 2-oxo acid dehydrogenase subunit E2 [Alphaproteobacteria bacterium]